MNNLPILSCEKLQELDWHAIENVGIPQAALMEEAAERIFSAMIDDFSDILTCEILVFAGCGNNGADSLCVARKLFLAGAKVSICICNDKGSDLFMQHLTVCKNIGIAIKTVNENPYDVVFDFIIDGIFGVGYKYNPLRSFPLPVKWRSVMKNATVLAIDIPSGLGSNDDSGIQADVTYSIGYPKTIFYNAKNRAFCGRIRHIKISFDNTKANSIAKLAVSMNEPKISRDDFVHKYKRGSCLIVGGSPGKNGAVSYSASTAFSAGSGIVAILTGKSNFPDVANVKKEAVYDVIENIFQYKHYSCTVIGPGLGALTDNEKLLLVDFIKNYTGQLIFDASFFTVFSKDVLENCMTPPLLTPHSGEFVKFFGENEISVEQACSIAKKYNCNLLLKDSFMILAMSDGTATVFDCPMRIVAQAGSGDLLVGYIAGNILQNKDFYNAICLSVMRFYEELGKITDRKFYLPEELILNLSYYYSG